VPRAVPLLRAERMVYLCGSYASYASYEWRMKALTHFRHVQDFVAAFEKYQEPHPILTSGLVSWYIEAGLGWDIWIDVLRYEQCS
jgi:hypothetical protein